MFQKSIRPDEAVALIYPTQNRVDTAIHMLFMNFDIAVIWLDNQMKVVDIIYARKWMPFYAPAVPASIVVEAHTLRLNDFRVNDQLSFEECTD